MISWSNRPRDPARKRKWRVENTVTGEGYEIIPGPDDGVATWTDRRHCQANREDTGSESQGGLLSVALRIPEHNQITGVVSGGSLIDMGHHIDCASQEG